MLFVLMKLYHFVIVKNMFDAIDEFRNEENRVYFVNTVMSENVVSRREILLKQDVMKYINRKSDLEVKYEWKNFENDKEYFFDMNNRKVYTNDKIFLNKDFLINMPNYIGYGYEVENKLFKVFDINHILPTKYNNELCYKIITKNEIIIIDRNTYLPIYSSTKMADSADKSKTKLEKTYEFKVGEVTDEDVALPDLSEYTIVE